MRTLLLVLTLITVACGSSPTPLAPTPLPSVPVPDPFPPPLPPQVAQIAGEWTGTMQFLFQGVRGGVVTRAILQQTGRSVTGTWLVTTAGNDIRGDIRGMLDGAEASTVFVGTVTWNSAPATGTDRCVGTATFRGTAVPPVLTWESATGWDFGLTCSSPPQEVKWVLVRTG